MRDMPTVNVTNALQEKAMAVIAVARENDITSTEIEAMDAEQRALLLETAGVEADPSAWRGSVNRIMGVAAHLWMTPEERAEKERRAAEARMAPKGECRSCDSFRENGETFFPSHNASARCRSGKHAHCTCSTCF